MNKKYIDFVPKTTDIKNVKVAKRKPAKIEAPVEEPAVEFEMSEIFEERESDERGLRLGEIEDYSDKFVKTKVEKRPLSEKREVVKQAKAKKVGARMTMLGKVKASKAKNAALEKETIEKARKQVAKEKMQIPRRPFVNTEKVEKRPLSRNAYPVRQAVAPKEEPRGTVTIIEKPEKDSRVGLIVTIIITIILGAAAGTVAFLLLPK